MDAMYRVRRRSSAMRNLLAVCQTSRRGST
jgi:hypothetical protein